LAFIDRIRACNGFDPAGYRRFLVDGTAVGYVTPAFARLLEPFADVFRSSADGVHVAPALATPEARTAAVDAVLRRIADAGHIRGWRDEPYPVAAEPGGPPLMLMERAAIPRFGVRAAGIHVNGFVRTEDGLAMWIGRRSLHKPTAPGKLDQLVAGGQSAGHGIVETMIKESHEEASIPEALARQARPVGAVTYATEREEGLRRDVVYVFDLELPADFTPAVNDDEIVAFYRWPIGQVIEAVRDSDAFKFNCALVIIDFLIRHGLLAHDEPDYLALVRGLRGE
jgi:8-oxo-dGTP pyrophosphatase MutT (NUDIX family)